MISIYNKNAKYKATLNYTIEEFQTEWYSDWEEGDLISATKLRNPIIDGGMIREMTREEMVENDIEVSLADGEYIENKKIKSVEKPSDLMRPLWNKDTHTWQEGMTREELMTERKNKILKYAELKKEIETLTEFSDEFESDNTVEMLKLQMQQLKKEINELLEVIKKM